jgi:hypothetical protein
MGDWWSHLDPATKGAVVGGIIAGATTLIGGFGGAWLIGWLDSKREERQQLRDHGAAVRAVIYELTTILAGLSLILKDKKYVPIDTPDWAYRSVFMVLIARMPEAVAQRVAFAYSQLPILRYHLNEGSKGSSVNWEAVEAVATSMSQVYDDLRAYAEQSLKIDVRSAPKSRAAARRQESTGPPSSSA